MKKVTSFLSVVLLCMMASFAQAQNNNAFGNNLRVIDSTLVGGNYQYIYAIYSGDVNQDGSIDISDFNALEPAVLSFSTGYIDGDLNGDGKADITDFNIMENNVLAFIEVKKP